jgi:hypothetical protein
MSKPKKIMLGLLTIWPIIYFAVFVLFVFSQVLIPLRQGPVTTPTTAIAASSTTPTSVVANTGVPGWFLALAALHLGTGFVLIVLIAIYIRDIFKNDRVMKDKKALWAVCIFLGTWWRCLFIGICTSGGNQKRQTCRHLLASTLSAFASAKAFFLRTPPPAREARRFTPPQQSENRVPRRSRAPEAPSCMRRLCKPPTPSHSFQTQQR